MTLSKTTLLGAVSGIGGILSALLEAYAQGKFNGLTIGMLIAGVLIIIIGKLTKDGKLNIVFNPVVEDVTKIAEGVISLESKDHPTNQALAAISDGLTQLIALQTANTQNALPAGPVVNVTNNTTPAPEPAVVVEVPVQETPPSPEVEGAAV